MLPAIQQIISPKSSQDDASTLTDAYFSEIGFKCADNSMLGSTESPDLDGEDYIMDDRSLGLAGLGESSTLDVEEGADEAEPDILPPPPMESADGETQSKNANKNPSALKAYSKPFHSYFAQLLSTDGRSTSDSLNYSPTSAYNIQVLRPPNSPEDDVSTLGDGSYTRAITRNYNGRAQRGTPTNNQADTDIKQTNTGSTLEQTDTKEFDDFDKQDKNSISSIADAGTVARRWKCIYCIIGVALLLLTTACLVLALSIVQLKNDDDSSLQTADDDGLWTFPPVQSPGLPDVQTRQDLLRILALVSPTSLTALSNFTSPQYLAFEWLADDPEYLGYSPERVIQRWTLATFYYALNPNRRLSDFETTWISYQDECTWYTTDPLDVCDQQGNLVAIHLDGAGLDGELPLELGLLSSTLERLYLNSNSLVGTIPTELGKLTKLSRLQLTSNSISGEIPSELQQISSLSVLGLGRNKLVGSIPPELGGLSDLKTLGLERNQFSGQIPVEFASMSSLVEMSLDSNNLNGTVPTDLGTLPNLAFLSLHNNELTGSMPQQLCPSANRSLSTLTADCDEISCPCCTSCCVECIGSGGTLIPRTDVPSAAPLVDQSPSPEPVGSLRTEMPSWSPTEAPSSVPSDLPSLIPSDLPSLLPSAIPSDLPSIMPSSFPSHLPSIIPSTLPSLTPSITLSNSPSECVVSISSPQECYVSTVVPFSFKNCNALANDWIGMFSVQDIIDLGAQGDLQLTRQRAVAWSRTCGSQFCLQPRSEGTIRFGGQRLDRGSYLVYLVRANEALASVSVRVDWDCF